MKQKKITDLIKIEDVRRWSNGDTIVISAPTGTGKSYFVKNIIYLVAAERKKKILFLVHRKRCKQQFFEELKRDKKLDVINILTYQALEQKKDIDISQYDYIVCDEFHYFTGDSNFNYKTDKSLEKILKANVVKIFMSATGRLMEAYIQNRKGIETINYKIDDDFSWMKLHFYSKDKTLEVVIDEVLEKEEKMLIFIDNAEKAYDLYKKYKDKCLFCCAENNRYFKHVDEDKIEEMLEHERFPNNILITTNCLDAGINLNDDDIKTIVCDIRDTGVLVQCLGRKRRKEDEKVDVYIKNISNQQLGASVRDLSKATEMVRDLEKMTIDEWTEKYSKEDNRLYGTLIYDHGKDKKVNELMKFKIMERIVIIEMIVGNKKEGLRGMGYKNYLKNNVFKVEESIDRETYYEEIELKEWLGTIKGRKLYKDEQKALINKINVRVDGKQQKSYNKLNNGLKMLKLPYVILPKKSGNERYWIVEDIAV
ncbi:MAG: DEAD/DEAH box helicase family protein [Clostridium sp.]